MQDGDLGLELLMNPKKRSSDAMSVISSISGKSDVLQGARNSRDSDASSIKSVNIAPQVIDVKAFAAQESGSEGDDLDDDVFDVDDDSFDAESKVEIEDAQSEGRRSVSSRSHSHRSDVRSEASYVARPRGPSITRRDAGTGVYSMTNRMSDEESMNLKRELLYQFDRLEKKGMKLPRKFTLSSSLDDMKLEFDRLKRDREIDNSVQFQRKTMVTVVSGIELLNTWFNTPARLDGWSDSINEKIEEFDSVFEELHDKYKGKAKMAPEIKLLLMVGASGLMHHMLNNVAKASAVPGLDQILKQNPELAKQFAAATANTMAQQQARSNPMSGFGNILSSVLGGGGGGGLGGLFASMMGGGGGTSDMSDFHAPPPQQPVAQATNMSQMRGPSNVEDILRDIDNDRIEVMSTVTGSELTEFADDASINNLLMNKRGRRGKRTLEI